MSDNLIQNKSYQFALRIIKLCLWLKESKHYELSSQLLRCGTSIGATVEEALAGHSKKDFLHKMNIATKEARETNYWLRLLKDAGILSDAKGKSIIDESSELVKILTSIVKTGQENSKKQT